MRKQAKGWTHPEHWVVVALGTLCQMLAAVFVLMGLLVIPLFTDNRAMPALAYKAVDMDIKCEDSYCYKSMSDMMQKTGEAERLRAHVMDITNKAEPAWLSTARILIFVGTASNILSLALLMLVFWPVVLAGKVLNFILHICRLVDFIGAPTKFVGVFCLLWYISDINVSYSWWRYEGVLQMDPLPLGLVLFSYILQTLCFVCATLATDKGARGEQTHVDLLRRQSIIADLEFEEEDKFRRVSYQPIDTKRSSKLLSEVEQHFSTHESIV